MIIDDTKSKKKLPSEVYKKKVCDLPGRSEKRTLALKSKQKEFRGTLFLLWQMRFKNIFVLFLRKYIGVAEVCCLFLKINISQYQYSFANGLWYYYNCDNSKEKYWNVIQNGKKKYKLVWIWVLNISNLQMMSKVVFDLFLIYAQIYFFPKRNMIMYLQFILLFIFFYSVLPICLILPVLFCFRNVCTFPSPIECMFHYYVDAVSIF